MRSDARVRGQSGSACAISPELRLDYPTPSTPAVTAVMRANRKVDTTPERRLRSELHRRGLRFRKHLPIEANGIRVKPDVIFSAKRVAVFVDGCFWHACPEHGNQPKANSEYWSAKLSHNQERDAQVDEALSSTGWLVVRVWEHVAASEAADCVTSTLQSRTDIGAGSR